MKIRWAVQVTCLTTWSVENWGDAVQEAGQILAPVYLRPFEYDLSAMVDFEPDDVPTVFIGSTKLIQLVRDNPQLGFNPGVFINDKFDYRVSVEENGDRMLNHDAVYGKLPDIRPAQEEGPIFIRPVLDLKSFTGTVLETYLDYCRWEDQLNMAGHHVDHSDIDVVISRPKQIKAEYRCHVVDNQIVDVRRYQLNGRLTQDPVKNSVHGRLQQFMSEVVTPHEIVVVDVADTPEGMKVIEFNTMNGSGLYGHDATKIVTHISDYLGAGHAETSD